MKFAGIAWLGSVLLMAGALYFQYGMDMRPCQLCIYQRIPHAIVIALGAYALLARKPSIFPLLAVIVWVGAGIAFFHVGVEQHWWEGLKSCSGDTSGSLDDLLATAPARCDEIPWSLFGLSMAAWNGIISVVLGVLWLVSWKQKK